MKRFLCVMAILAFAIPAFADCPNGRCGVNPYAQQLNWQAVVKPRPTPAFRYVTQTGHLKAVVRVGGETGHNERFYGSGTVIRWGSRVVTLTAAHVVRGCTKVFIRGRTKWHACRVLGIDTLWDVAVLSVNDPSDFSIASIATGVDGQVKVGDRVESCGFGPNDRFAVNSTHITGRSSPGKGACVPYDMIKMAGKGRQGDSGGSIFRKGKLVGVLWGGDKVELTATQVGRLHVIIRKAIGPAKLVRETALRDLVPFACRPQQRPQVRQVYQRPVAPQVTVNADPRVGNALMGISHKLDQVVVNTTPQPVFEAAEEKTKKINPILIMFAVGGGMALASVVFYGSKKG